MRRTFIATVIPAALAATSVWARAEHEPTTASLHSVTFVDTTRNRVKGRVYLGRSPHEGGATDESIERRYLVLAAVSSGEVVLRQHAP